MPGIVQPDEKGGDKGADQQYRFIDVPGVLLYKAYDFLHLTWVIKKNNVALNFLFPSRSKVAVLIPITLKV